MTDSASKFEVNQPLRIQVSSDIDYDFLLAEIESEPHAALILSRDSEGNYFLQWPRYDVTHRMARKVPLSDVMKAIEGAKGRIG